MKHIQIFNIPNIPISYPQHPLQNPVDHNLSSPQNINHTLLMSPPNPFPFLSSPLVVLPQSLPSMSPIVRYSCSTIRHSDGNDFHRFVLEMIYLPPFC